MGKLGFFNAYGGKNKSKSKTTTLTTMTGTEPRLIGSSGGDCGDEAIAIDEASLDNAEPLAEYDIDDVDDEDEESMLNRNKRFQQQQHQHQPKKQQPSCKKIYLLYFTATTAVVCFCFFILVPQLVDYFTDANVIEIGNSVYSSQRSVIELPDSERPLRNQERLDIMRRFDALQQKYKELQVEYKKAEEAYLKKLHNAVKDENGGSPTANGFAEPNELEIYKIEDVEKMNENWSAGKRGGNDKKKEVVVSTQMNLA